MYHHSFPLQTLCIQSIWQEVPPKAEHQPELTHETIPILNSSYLKKKILKQQQIKKLLQKRATVEIGASQKDAARLQWAED